MATIVPPLDSDIAARQRIRIRISGVVQGVGFRPFIYRQATVLGLGGWVINSPQGVTIEAEGAPSHLGALVEAIGSATPANAVVSALEKEEIAPRGERVFVIRESENQGERTARVLPDLATCPDCLVELFDSSDRRHLYPFINCTQCGPRYSIIEGIPYDRARTSMRRFEMCDACRAEYENPLDRRFHAEPNGCPDCGPRLALWNGRGSELSRDHDAVFEAAVAIREGRVVAVKGIGGFHLAVDGRNETAVRRLRARKQREEKPFAVMFPTIADALASCHISLGERALLEGPARPITLVRRTGGPVCDAVAPGGNPWLGVLLPYAPLHHLLMQELGFPVVATSGNISDEPIIVDEDEAIGRLFGVADLFLVHDRPIVRPIDDSVVRVVSGRELLLRRGRGYAPAPVEVDGMPDGILAVGGHLKTTVALTRPGSVVVSQHLGDLGAVEARAAHARAIDDAIRLHEVRPRRLASDIHPDYASTRAAESMGLPVTMVQHHLAHVVACMAENEVAPPALGVAWDGAGYGPDGTVWGGEFLEVARSGWRRVAHLRRFPLPGGEAAAREPRRAALGLLFEAYGERAFDLIDLAPVAAFTSKERVVLGTMLLRGVNAPVTTSAGRLFDAFSALCGLRQRASFEGQAAAEFEWAAESVGSAGGYDFPVLPAESVDAPMIVDWQPALESAIADVRAGKGAGSVSAAVHNGLCAAIAEVAVRAGRERVVLSGGCFQNARLTEGTVAALRAAGRDPVWHRRIPPNDGGLSLGQAVWTAWTEAEGGTPCA